MTSYYAVPVRRECRTLSYDPLDGHCALAATPHDALIQLGMPEVGAMFAVWPLTRKVTVEEAGRVCSILAPLRIYVVLDSVEGVILPLSSTVIYDVIQGVADADRD